MHQVLQHVSPWGQFPSKWSQLPLSVTFPLCLWELVSGKSIGTLDFYLETVPNG